MDDTTIAEVIKLMSLMSQNDIKNALQVAFSHPDPLISASTVREAVADWKSPEAQFLRLLRGEVNMEKPPTMRAFQHHRTYEDGTQAVFEVEHPLKTTVNMAVQPKVDVETLWKRVAYMDKAGQKADAFLKAVDRFDTLPEKIDLLMKAAEKCGIPKTEADLLAKNGDIGSTLKTALTRDAVKTAVRDGAWQSAALMAVFDIKRLFDGDFKRYLINIGVSGLYGGTVSGLSSWVNHPFFGNSIVLGFFVHSAFGAVSLASTGDWARFGKGLGVSIIGGAGACAGAAAGAALGTPFGGIFGLSIGAIIGGLCGGLAGRQVAGEIPGLGGMTEHEVRTAYDAITQQLASAGLEPDPSQTPKQVVEATMNKGAGSEGLPFNVRMTSDMASGVTNLRELLLDLQEVSPDAFREFRDTLRAAHNEL